MVLETTNPVLVEFPFSIHACLFWRKRGSKSVGSNISNPTMRTGLDLKSLEWASIPSLNGPLFHISNTICIVTTFPNLNLHLTSIEWALARLIVPSAVPTIQPVALKGSFHALFMLIFVQIYQCSMCVCDFKNMF